MPEMTQNVGSPEERIYALEKAVLVMDTRLESNEKVLVEIKNVLVEQNKVMQEVVRLQQQYVSLERQIIDLKEELDTSVDPSIEESKDFMSKVKGGIIVFGFLFSVIQGVIMYEINQVFTRVSNIENNENLIEQKYRDNREQIREIQQMLRNNS